MISYTVGKRKGKFDFKAFESNIYVVYLYLTFLFTLIEVLKLTYLIGTLSGLADCSVFVLFTTNIHKLDIGGQ